MNKRKILIILLIGIVVLLSSLVYNIITTSKEKNKITKQLKTIPKFELKTLDNYYYTNSNLEPNIPYVFIYFNSDCYFCEHEAQNISQNLDKFTDVQFIFVSTESIDIINKFAKEYQLNNKNNITFLYDSDYHFSKQFNAQTIPYILIYGKNKELIKKHNGQLNAYGILRELKQND